MEQKPFHNGNGGSASDIETSHDSVAKETVQQREKIDHYANQFQLSNVVVPLYNNNNNTGSNIFSETYISENEFSNSSDIMEETPRKKPLLSLNENLYMNVESMKDINVAGTFTNPLVTVETNNESLKAVPDPESSKTETIENGSSSCSIQRLQNTVLSPNNNSCNISVSNTTQNDSQSIVSNAMFSSSKPDVPNSTSFSPQYLNTLESKSSWQFCPHYGLSATSILDSSQGTSSPNSDMSPDISCLQDGFESLSEADEVVSDVPNELDAQVPPEKEKCQGVSIDSPSSTNVFSDASPSAVFLREHSDSEEQGEKNRGKDILDFQLLSGNSPSESYFLHVESTKWTDHNSLLDNHEQDRANSKTLSRNIPTEAIYANVCQKTQIESQPSTNAHVKTERKQLTSATDTKVVPLTYKMIEMQCSPVDLVSLGKCKSLKKQTPGKVEICIQGVKPSARNLRVKKTDVPNVTDLCLPLEDNSRVKPSAILQRDAGLNLLAFPQNTSLSCCEIHPLSSANPRSPLSLFSENGSTDIDSRLTPCAMSKSSLSDAGPSVLANGACLESRPKDLCFNNQRACILSQTNFVQPSGNQDLPKSSPKLVLLTDPNPSERFISLKDYSEAALKDSEDCDEVFRQGDNYAGASGSWHRSGSSDRFSCLQGPSDHVIRRRDPKHKRPVSFHGSEDPQKFYTQENLYQNLSPQNFPQLGAVVHMCTSRQTQTDFNRPCGLRQSNSFTAMPRHRACQTKGCLEKPTEGFKMGSKVNLGVSSLRSAFPAVQRQQKHLLPSSQTSDNFTGVISSLESSQSTPNFVGLCKLSCHPNYHPQLRPHASKETSWRYTRPVSDSGLFLRNVRFRQSQGNESNSEASRVPEFLRQISEHAQRAAMSEAVKRDRTFPPGNRNNFERRLSDPSYCVPQPPKRSASLGGNLVLAKSLSEPSFKNNPNNKSNSKANNIFQPSEMLNPAAPEQVYENVESTPQTSSPKVPLKPNTSNTACVGDPIYENLAASNAEPVVSHSRLSSISDSDSDSSDFVMNERRESYHSSDSSDADTETDNGDFNSGDNYEDSSDDTSDTVSMDDLLTRLGVITTQDGDADDEDGFQDSSDDEDEDELLLPISAPTRMCDRPPSPYPGLGDSTDEERPVFLSGVFHSVSFSSCDIIPNNGPSRPVRSRTEPDFLDFEILNPEDYGIQHPPSYTDLFPRGTQGQPDMPPSYDDAVRPFSVHQDHFDYSGLQSPPPTNNNRFSLPAPDWIQAGDEFLTNPPPAYDEAVLVQSGRSNDELSNQSQESPVRRSRGRRVLNGLRRFARKIFR